MIACTECGRPLDPNTWSSTPYCYHDGIERDYGKEMTVEEAIDLANYQLYDLISQLADMHDVIQNLRSKRNYESIEH